MNNSFVNSGVLFEEMSDLSFSSSSRALTVTLNTDDILQEIDILESHSQSILNVAANDSSPLLEMLKSELFTLQRQLLDGKQKN